MVSYLRAEGSDEEADRLAEHTLSRYRITLGEKHPDTVASVEGRQLDFDFADRLEVREHRVRGICGQIQDGRLATRTSRAGGLRGR